MGHRLGLAQLCLGLCFLFCIINFGLYFLLSLEFTLGFFTSFLADEYVQQEKDSEDLI